MSSTNLISNQEKNNALNKDQKARKIQDWVKLYQSQIKNALPKVLTVERFSRMVLTAIAENPKLAECTPESFIGVMLKSDQLGLEPNTPLGQAYLIPYGGKCQFQIGYKGLLDLAYRSGELKNLESHIVYENDDFDFEFGLNSNLKHKPAMSNRGEPIWVYAIYRLKNEGYAFEVMSIEDIKQHAQQYSQNFNSKYSPWSTDFESMAKKTVIKRLLKYAPLQTERESFEQAVSFDDKTTAINFDNDNELIIVNDAEEVENNE